LQLSTCNSNYHGRCDFAYGICPFWTVESSDFDWSFYKGTDPALGTGPNVDHTTNAESGTVNLMFAE